MLDLFFKFSIVSSFLPFLIGLFSLRFFKKCEIIIFIHVGLAALTEIFAYIVALINGTNIFFISIYTLIELLVFILFYIAFFKSYFFTTIVLIAYLAFLTGYIIDWRCNDFRFMQHYSNAIESIIMAACAFVLFAFVMRNDITDNLLNEPYFWINSGILIYFSGNLLLFTLWKFVPLKDMNTLWGFIHNSLNFLLYLCFSIGFWKTRKRI